MMENAIKYGNFIKRIFTTRNVAVRKSLIKTSNEQIIKAISEILLNLYHKTLPAPISPTSLKLFRRCKAAILKIINKNTTSAKRRQLLLQNSESLVGIAEIFK